jgi:hypothetical protein
VAASGITRICYGFRLVERDGRRMLPELLGARGVRGPAVGVLQREGAVSVDGVSVALEEVSEVRLGQRFALQRYNDPALFAQEAGSFFDGEVTVAEDLTRIPVPARRP